MCVDIPAPLSGVVSPICSLGWSARLCPVLSLCGHVPPSAPDMQWGAADPRSLSSALPSPAAEPPSQLAPSAAVSTDLRAAEPETAAARAQWIETQSGSEPPSAHWSETRNGSN